MNRLILAVSSCLMVQFLNNILHTSKEKRQEAGGRRQEAREEVERRKEILFLPFNWGCEALLGSSKETRQKAEGRRKEDLACFFPS